MRVANKVQEIVDRQGFVLLDGGLATELEARGHDLRDELWSARLLDEDPEAIRQLHLDYLEAGADCIVTASYQATLEGFRRKGIDESRSRDLLRASVRLALEARETFLASHPGAVRFVAASVGPYGAFLADGSEYRDYEGVGENELIDFHRERWKILSSAGADLLACETIPSIVEAHALRRLLEETDGPPAWVSFSCRDGAHVSDGTAIEDAVQAVERCTRVFAVGVNCTAPEFIAELVSRIASRSKKTIVVYPNRGETYDSRAKQWVATPVPTTGLAAHGRTWLSLGARLIGGCCRTSPEDIRELRLVLQKVQ